MAERLTLIERLEKATGPDRSIDFQICLTSGYWPKENIEEIKYYDDGEISGLVFKKDMSMPCQPFTASLDATVSLVEQMLPGWEWRAERRYAEILEAVGEGDDRLGRLHIGHGESPAIALLVALFRAHSEGGNKP